LILPISWPNTSGETKQDYDEARSSAETGTLTITKAFFDDS
jgi:hypothetical protein